MNPDIQPRLTEAFRKAGSDHLKHVITHNHYGWHVGVVARAGSHFIDMVFAGHDDGNPNLPVTDDGYWVEMDPTLNAHAVAYEPADSRLDAAAATLLRPNHPVGAGRYYRLGSAPIREALEEWRQVSKAVNRALSGKDYTQARAWVAAGGMNDIYAAVAAPVTTRPAPENRRPQAPPGNFLG